MESLKKDLFCHWWKCCPWLTGCIRAACGSLPTASLAWKLDSCASVSLPIKISLAVCSNPWPTHMDLGYPADNLLSCLLLYRQQNGEIQLFNPAVENLLWCLQIPAILTPFLGVTPRGLAQPEFPASRLFSPAQCWKSPLSSPLPQPVPPGPACTHLPWVIPSTLLFHTPVHRSCRPMAVLSACLCLWSTPQKEQWENLTGQELQWLGFHQRWNPYISFSCPLPPALLTGWFSGQWEGRRPSLKYTSSCMSICYSHTNTSNKNCSRNFSVTNIKCWESVKLSINSTINVTRIHSGNFICWIAAKCVKWILIMCHILILKPYGIKTFIEWENRYFGNNYWFQQRKILKSHQWLWHTKQKTKHGGFWNVVAKLPSKFNKKNRFLIWWIFSKLRQELTKLIFFLINT